jgi:hypothetical protein
MGLGRDPCGFRVLIPFPGRTLGNIEDSYEFGLVIVHHELAYLLSTLGELVS